jgi:hypothetical protein
MSIFNNPFRPLNNNEKMTPVNLETPKTQSPASTLLKQIDPKLLEVAAPDIARLAKRMLETGKRPQAFYLAVNGSSGLVSLRTANPDRTTLLIFTSGYAALDYLRTAKIPGGIHMFPTDSLPAYIEQWKKMKVDFFVLDRCPRCAHFVSAPIEECTEEKFIPTGLLTEPHATIKPKD